jgi:hypothetical protein
VNSAVWVDRCAQRQTVGAPEREERRGVDPAHPRDHRTVVEPDHQLGSHLHAAVEPFDDAHDVGLRLARRHEIDHADTPRRGLPLALEDQRVVAVAPRRRVGRAGGSKQPAAVLAAPEDRAEAGARVEAGEGQPVDRPVAAHERRRLQVAEKGVVLDAFSHG